MMQVFQ